MGIINYRLAENQLTEKSYVQFQIWAVQLGSISRVKLTQQAGVCRDGSEIKCKLQCHSKGNRRPHDAGTAINRFIDLFALSVNLYAEQKKPLTAA